MSLLDHREPASFPGSRRQWLRTALSLGLGGRLATGSLGWLAGQGLAVADPTSRTAGQTARFALLCDTSYDDAEAADLPEVIKAAQADSDFIVHLGDIKSGIESCDDDMLWRRLAPLRQARVPLVFVPGDNEWLDCHRLLAGSFDPLERLGKLRELAYASPPAAGMPPGWQWQRGTDASISTSETGSAWPEHQRWRAGPAMFVTLNVPGSKNGLTTRIPAQVHRRRATAVTRWLLQSADTAALEQRPVLVIGFHAWVDLRRLDIADLDADVIDEQGPYGWFRALVWRCVARFPGTVLLLSGDAHAFRDERPWQHGRHARRAADRFDVDPRLVEQRMRRLRWVQGFGSPHSRRWLQIVLSVEGDASPRIDVLARRV